jgi:CRISP-associated protein Cas1
MKPFPMLQTEYFQSEVSVESSRNIIAVKAANMIGLLKSHLAYNNKKYPDRAAIIRINILKMMTLHSQIPAAKNRRHLMLIEARITHIYWQTFSILVGQGHMWTRIHPGGDDMLNQSLNIGYTYLLTFLKKHAGDMPCEIGMLHAPRKDKTPLLYDLEELFRQPLVDAPLLTYFSKYKPKEISVATIIFMIQKNLAKKVHNRYWKTWDDIIATTFVQYKKSVQKNVVWKPYGHSWSHWTKR